MRKFLAPTLLASLVLLCASPPAGAQTTWFVDDDNTAGPWDGTQAHPFQLIKDGIDAAVQRL